MSTLVDSERLGGDYRWLWEITYDCRRRLCHSEWGTGEVVTDGWEPYIAKYHVIAPTEPFARTAWMHNFAYDPTNAIKTCEKMLRVDAEISIQGSRA